MKQHLYPATHTPLTRLNLMHSVAAPAFAVAINLLIVFVAFTLCRIEFFLENRDFFADALSEGRLLQLLGGGVVFDTPGIFYCNILYIFMMLLPLHLKERPAYYMVCKWVYVVINSVAVAANLADSVYFRFTMRRTTWDVASEFAGENNLGKIIFTEIISHWYLAVMLALMVWGMWRLYVSPRINIRHQKLGKYYIVAILGLLCGAITTISAIRGGYLNHWYNYIAALILAYVAWRLFNASAPTWRSRLWGYILAGAAAILFILAPIGGWRHRDIRPIAISNAGKYIKRPTEAALVLNTPFTFIRTIGARPFSDPHYFDNKAELDALYTPIHLPPLPSSQTSATAPGNGKNVVVIIIESFGREYIGALNKEMLGSDYKGYTPFTDSLVRHSAVWHDSFSNGRKSIDGMPSILAGIPAFVKPFVLTSAALNKLQGLPNALSSKGYDSAFFHGARTGSMGFDAFAKSIGFKAYYGREDFNTDKRFGGDKDFDGYWAIWDEPFLQYYALKMTEMKQPFVTAVFTASSHHPFHVPAEYAAKYTEEELPIHKCIRYTDNALRHFFATARTQPWFDNTIFVITSDHTNQSNHAGYKSDIGGYRSPIIIYDPNGEFRPGMRAGVAQHIDIMPTVLGYLGYDRPYLSFGIDLERTPAEETWAVTNNNGVYQYVKHGYVLQFDGEKTIGLYRLDDYEMKHNLRGVVAQQPQMERELKAIIQSYMDRMSSDRLTPER